MKAYWRDIDPTTRLTDPHQVQPPQETTFAEAQTATNFVVFRPEWLPSDCAITQVTLRPEQPPGRPGDIEAQQIGQTPWSEGNPCSVRTVVTGDQRRLRIKQFLYDWAPPAASTPALWKSPHLTPVLCQDTIAWLGTDYMGRQGGCVQQLRTQLELSVERGHFTSEELSQMLQALTPADLEASQPVQGTPFHQLNYWVRYQLAPVQVPYGLWYYRRARRYDRSTVVSFDELEADSPVPIVLPAGEEFVFDSAVTIQEPQANHHEFELVLRHRANQSDHLWFSVMNADSDLAWPIPPEPDEHPAQVHQAISLRGTTVWYAALHEQYGAWEAFWEENGTRYAVWASTSLFLNGDQFKGVIAGLR
jgi:hypothetical protein